MADLSSEMKLRQTYKQIYEHCYAVFLPDAGEKYVKVNILNFQKNDGMKKLLLIYKLKIYSLQWSYSAILPFRRSTILINGTIFDPDYETKYYRYKQSHLTYKW